LALSSRNAPSAFSLRRYNDVEQIREALFSALSTFVFKFESGEEAQVVGLLMIDDLPTDDEWDRVFDFLDENENGFRACGNIFRALRQEHIQQLHDQQSDLLGALGQQYAKYCQQHQFDFSYCDALAGKAQVFYDLGDLQLKASITIAMLVLGTSHNRWFVERKFMQMAGVTISDDLANRIIVELNVLNVSFPQQFHHLEHSISAQRDSLHPVLRAQLIE
jgi:hypothetical protein